MDWLAKQASSVQQLNIGQGNLYPLDGTKLGIWTQGDDLKARKSELLGVMAEYYRSLGKEKDWNTAQRMYLMLCMVMVVSSLA